jgi:DNA-binding transcriptional MerR regulator
VAGPDADAAAGGGFTIGEAARRSRLTPKAIRLYEARGLLPPVGRTVSGYRVYSDHDLRLLGFIRRAREVGLGLDQIRAIIELRRTGTPPSEEVMAVLRARLAELDGRLGELHALRGTLAGVLDTVASAAGAGADPRLCRILERDG